MFEIMKQFSVFYTKQTNFFGVSREKIAKTNNQNDLCKEAANRIYKQSSFFIDIFSDLWYDIPINSAEYRWNRERITV